MAFTLVCILFVFLIVGMNTRLRGWRILDGRIITRRHISQNQTRSLLYTVELEYISHVHKKLYHGHMSVSQGYRPRAPATMWRRAGQSRWQRG
jgi:hypothetical protein